MTDQYVSGTPVPKKNRFAEYDEPANRFAEYDSPSTGNRFAEYDETPEQVNERINQQMAERAEVKDRGFIDNSLRSLGAGATKFVEGAMKGAAALESLRPAGHAMVPSYAQGQVSKQLEFEEEMAPEEFEEHKDEQYERMTGAAEKVGGVDFGYDPDRNSVEKTKDLAKKGNWLGAIASAPPMLTDQLIQSVPYMLNAPMTALSYGGNVASERVENTDGKTRPDARDVTIAATAGTASGILERLLPKALFRQGREITEAEAKAAAEAAKRYVMAKISKEAAKDMGIEGMTEAVQEGVIEYVGSRYGTDAAMSVQEAALTGLEAGLIGAGIGGGLGAGRGTYDGAREVKAARLQARATPEAVEAELDGDIDIDAELAEYMGDLDDIGPGTDRPAPEAAESSILSTDNPDLTDYDVGLTPLENPVPGEMIYWAPEGGAQSLARFEGLAGEMGGQQIAKVVVDGREELVPMQDLYAGEYQQTPETGFGGPAEATLPDDAIPYEPPAMPERDSGLSLQQPGQETSGGIDYVPPERPGVDEKAQPVVEAINENLRQQEQDATRQALESETAVPVRPEVDPAEQAELYPPDPSAPRPGPAAERISAAGDTRLSRPEYRDRLAAVSSELEKGGGVSYIRDEHDRITGRTPSVNPDWFKVMNEDPETKMSVEDTRAAIDKALKGEKLGVRQLRVVGTALDAIGEERGSYAREIRAMRENAREDRRRAFEQWLEATDVPVDADFEATVWPESPGEVYNEPDYLPNLEMESRAVTELMESADALGVDWSAIDAALAEPDVNAQTKALTQLIWDTRNEHRAESTEQATRTASTQSEPGALLGATEALEEAPADKTQPAQAGEVEKPAPTTTVKAEETAPRKLQQHIKANTEANPTEAQKEAGNHRKASISVQGLDISIEVPRGSTRSGTDSQGNRWESKMHSNYGYLKRTTASDGENVDVFVGPNPASDKVFIVDQVNQQDGSYDESKVLLGYDSKLKARSGYKSNYSNGWKVGPITSMTMDEFKAWLKDGNTKKPLNADHFADAGKKVESKPDQENKPQTPPETPVVPIEDAGEKLGGARKDELRTVRERLENMDDEAIASSTLSKMFPKSEIDKVEDKKAAAIYHAAREAIPAKPRKSYRLKRWVDTVRQARDLIGMVEDVGADALLERIAKADSSQLRDLARRVEVMNGLDRGQWDRIGVVTQASGRYSKGGGEMVSGAWVTVDIDGRLVSFYGHDTIQSALPDIRKRLDDKGPAEKKLKFAVYQDLRAGEYFIAQDSDKEKRRLKTFESPNEARAFVRDNHDDLMAAWEAVKNRDNVTRSDMRRSVNAERTGTDYRDGKDVTPEQFLDAFGFRGVEFGNWVKQGKGAKERQSLLNDAYDAFMDLADVLNLPPKALSLEGRLGIGMGSRGRGGKHAAHFEPGSIVINLTKTKGAGSLAHEWFHALDNYFARKRGEPVYRGDDDTYRREAFVTYLPEPMMVRKDTVDTAYPLRMPKERLERQRERSGNSEYAEDRWIPDPNHKQGVRPEVERSFAELVQTLDKSPMRGRSSVLDKGKVDGYWSQIIERAARSFENYIIVRLADRGHRNDFLANVASVDEFNRNPERYPYLKDNEVTPVAQAFDNLFETLETKETDSGVSLFSVGDSLPTRKPISKEAATRVIDRIKSAAAANQADIRLVDSYQDMPEAIKRDAERQGYKADRVRGVFYGGNVYLNREALANESEVEQTVFHELYGHYGIGRLFDSATRQAMGKLYLRVGGIKGVRELAKKHGVDLETYVKGLGKAVDSGQMDRETAQGILAEELLAHIAQDSKPGVARALKEFIGAIRDWLRKNGFLVMSKVTDSEIMNLLRQARQAVNEGRVTGSGGLIFDLLPSENLEAMPAFSVMPNRTRRIIGDDPVLAGWTLLAMRDDAFKYPISSSETLDGVFDDLSVGPDGNTGIQIQRDSDLDKDGAKVWRITQANHDRFALVFEKKDSVWIDVYEWGEGGGGSHIYNAVANYAHNTGKTFIGDPDGLTDVSGMTRRLENMISSALKFGTTKHLWPHDKQLEGNEHVGAIKWKYGDDVHNLRQMIVASYESVAAQFPEIGDLVYNHTTDQIEGPGSKEWTRNDFYNLASKKRPVISGDAEKGSKQGEKPTQDNPGRTSGVGEDASGPESRSEVTAGSTTLERAVFTNTLLRRKGKALTELLANIGQLGSERLNQVLYSIDSEPRQQGGVSASGVAENISGLRDQIAAMGVTHSIAERQDAINVSRIVVPADQRNQGTGTSAMQAIMDYADRKGKRVELSPSSDFGGSKLRLRKFYKRLGFLENKGRNRNLEISEEMYREPRPSAGVSRSGDVLFSITDDSPLFAAPKEAKLYGIPKDWILRKVTDKMRPLLQTQREIEKAKGSPLDEALDVYRMEEAFHGKTENDIRKLRERFIEPLTKKMAEYDISQEELDMFLWARHAPERNAQIAKINPEMPDGGSGMTTAQAKQVLAKAKATGKLDQMVGLANYIYAMQKRKQELLGQHLVEQDQLNAWNENYKYYVPLKGRALDESNVSYPRIGKGFDIRGKETLRALGRRTQPESPILHSIIDTTEAVIRARKNEVGLTFLNLVEQYPNPDYWEVFTSESPELEPRLFKTAGGETVGQGPVIDRSKYFSVKRDGKEHFIKINDELLMKAMKNMGPEPMNKLTQYAAHVSRFLSSVNTSFNPEFVVTNAARDIQTAVVNVLAEQDLHNGRVRGKEIAAKMVRSAPKAAYAIRMSLAGKKLKGDAGEWQKTFDQFREDGAKTGWFDAKDLDGQKKELQKMLDLSQNNLAGKVLRTRKAVAEFVENTNSAVENAVRLSVYKHALDAGVSRKKAAELAKNLTVNFNRKGEIGQTMNALYMFFNASVQGTMTFARAIGTLKEVDGKKTLNAAQKVGLAAAAGAFGLAVLNREMAGEDDDGENWYDKVPDWVKERNIVIMKSMVGGEPGEYWKIPLPYGYNIFHVFGTQVEAVTMGTTGVGEGAMNVAKAAVGSFVPLSLATSDETGPMIARSITPTIGKPFIDLAYNENFWGGPIYRDNMDFAVPKADAHLYKRSTPEVWKGMAQFMNKATGGGTHISGWADVNPDSLDYLFKYFTGGAGAFASRVQNAATKTALGVELDDREIPFLRQVSGKVAHWDDVSSFYDRKEEAERLEAEWKTLNGKDRISFYKEHGAKIRLQTKADGVAKELSSLRKQRDRIEASELSARKKDQRLKKIEERMKRAVDRLNRAWPDD